MASPDVVAPALLFPLAVVSLAASLFNYLSHGSAPAKPAILVLLAVLAAVAGGSALGVPHGEPLGAVAKVFTALLHATLSSISIYALSRMSALLPHLLRFFLSLPTLLVACELVASLIPTSPPLLPVSLALVSYAILLTLTMATAIFLRCRCAASALEMPREKGHLATESSGRSLGRVSSPTQATWPFPGSLALQDKLQHAGFPANQTTQPDLAPSSTSTPTHKVGDGAYTTDGQNLDLLLLLLVVAQTFATVSAGLDVAASILVDNMADRTNRSLQRVVLASAACTMLGSIAVVTVIQVLPGRSRPYSSEKSVPISYEQGVPVHGSSAFFRDHPAPRTPKRSLSRRESDSLLDFLSLCDPFASLPPPPPPLPLVGLGLDEVDVGWNRNREIGVQYRFPAPRSITKGGRRKGKTVRGHSNDLKRLAHQDSACTLLPVPETKGTEADVEKEKGFGDEARLAQLLLQSLIEGEDADSPNATMLVPTVTPPQAAHVQQTSRWSTCTTIQSIMSASVSNKSGVSTYTTCASEKIQTSRISMNTVASVLGSRKSSEAKRKSAMAASSSKG